MTRTGPAVRYWFATLALSAAVAVGPARAQSQNTTPQDRDADLTRQQLSVFDSFLDGHRELADQLHKNPSLVNSEEFVENHPDLQSFLQSHPEIKQDLAQDPNAAMHQEQRYDRREDQDRDRDRSQNRDRNDGRRGELSAMDHFMDGYPEIAEQLRKDPSLVDNKQFLSSHPALQGFLKANPQLAEEYKENPNAFMHQEDRYDQREDRRNVATMDRFLDSHPEIAEQLQKKPGLVDNKEFLNSHPALQQFLASHPDASQDFKENPGAFMRQENSYEANGSGNGGMHRDNDGRRGELSMMDHFMDGHPEIAEQLRKDPSLVDNKQFLSTHPALQGFLKANPQLAEEYKENPNAFMHQENRYDQREDRRNVATMDRFLDSHPEIAEQLQKKPGLVDNKQFVSSHPELQQFLASHPDASQDFKENPGAFMRQENQFDARGSAGMHRGSDVTGGELSSFHEFLEGHGAVAGELSKNPSLATNQEYLENHPALKSYLQSNPNVRQQLSENPQSFVKSAQQGTMPTKGLPKTTTTMTDPKMK